MKCITLTILSILYLECDVCGENYEIRYKPEYESDLSVETQLMIEKKHEGWSYNRSFDVHLCPKCTERANGDIDELEDMLVAADRL